MNNPDDVPVDIEFERDWIMAHKKASDLSWSVLGTRVGVNSSTLSLFGGGSYAGKNDKIALQIFKYRQLLESQDEQSAHLPVAPTFIQTPTAMRIRTLMTLSHGGRITLGATGPGMGKTMAMLDYQASVANCFVVTMQPVSKTLSSMVSRVLRAVGGNTGRGWMRNMSEEVISAVKGKRALLVVDEAGHLDEDSLEQLRAWHDETGMGICLLGNRELYLKVRGGTRNDTFGRLNSRIAMSHIRRVPEEEDIAMFLDAWGIRNDDMRRKLTQIGMTPSSGGLREIGQIIEIASMNAEMDGTRLELSHIVDAISERSTGDIRLVA